MRTIINAAIVISVSLIITAINFHSSSIASSGPAHSESHSAEPATKNERPTSINQRLLIARKALESGRMDQALVDFKISIRTEPDSAPDALVEMSNMFIERAASAALAGKPLERTRHLLQAAQELDEICAADYSQLFLSEKAHITLFEQIAVIKSICRRDAIEHLDKADKLASEALSSARKWYTLYLKYADDTEKQKAALREVNLAMKHLRSLDEAGQTRLANLQQQLKEKLSKSDYQEVMEKDKILLAQ